MIAIVVVGYSRPKQTKRLLDSIVQAEYAKDSVDLIISIDKGPLQAEVYAEAKAVQWVHGQKIIKRHPERMGLKAHILSCGDMAYQYDAVIVLEDDLVVSPGFYKFAKKCIEYYGNNEKITGISLYSHAFLPSVQRPFFPEWNGTDTYFMQYAQSWGQCWTRTMWDGFRKWYYENKNCAFENPRVPLNVRNWKHSWLKYYIQYTVEKDAFFVYPYHSLTTNLSESGEHCQCSSASYQVSLFRGSKEYLLADLKSGVKYDAFWERIDFSQQLPVLKDKSICMDLYGYKTAFDGYDYLFSTSARPFKVIDQYALSYRPHEINCFIRAEGEGIYLYDLKIPAKVPPKNDRIIVKYDIKDASFKKTWIFTRDEFMQALKIKVARLLKR